MKETQRLHPLLEDSEFSLDDVIFVPREIPDFELRGISTESKLTKSITLKNPLLSSPMDTVTDARMAILMAREGGIGVIHFNFPTISAQAFEVEKVRRFEAGFVLDPLVLGIDANVGDVFDSAEKNGFFSYPVTEDGTRNSPLVGIVTRRDVRYEEDRLKGVKSVMTTRDKLVTARREDTLDKKDVRLANEIIRKRNLDTLLIVDDKDRVVALVTDSDLSKNDRYPNATKDENHQLKVLAAIESRLERAKDRVGVLVDAGVSGFVVDARNIYRDHLEIAEYIKRNFKDVDVILGNVVDGKVVRDVLDEMGDYVDAFRVGIGTGEVCTTSEDLGLGRPMGSSVYDVAKVLELNKRKYGHMGLISDGGIKGPHHILKAFFLGADGVMMGSGLAGLDESPGEAIWSAEHERMEKKVRGMGSASAIAERAGSSRYMLSEVVDRFPEGIEKQVPYMGSGERYVRKLFNGVRQAMQGLGALDIDMLREVGYLIPASRALSKGSL